MSKVGVRCAAALACASLLVGSGALHADPKSGTAPPPPTQLAPPPAAECKPDSIHATDAEIGACKTLTKARPAQAAVAYAILCELFDKRMRRDEALSACNRAIAINPKLADAWSNRAQVYSDMYDFDRAIADFTRAIALEKKPAFVVWQ